MFSLFVFIYENPIEYGKPFCTICYIRYLVYYIKSNNLYKISYLKYQISNKVIKISYILHQIFYILGINRSLLYFVRYMLYKISNETY